MRLRALGPDWQPPHTALGSTKLRTVFAQVLYEGTKLRNVFAQVLPFCQRLPADFMEDKGHKVKGRGPGRPLKPAATKPPPPGTVSVIKSWGVPGPKVPAATARALKVTTGNPSSRSLSPAPCSISREQESSPRQVYQHPQLHQQQAAHHPQLHQQRAAWLS